MCRVKIVGTYARDARSKFDHTLCIEEMTAPVCAARVALCSTKGRPTKFLCLASCFLHGLFVSICVDVPTMFISKSENAHVFQETRHAVTGRISMFRPGGNASVCI